MYISRFAVSNYKSYRHSGDIELKPGFNIVTGQNSAGKTALLEAFSLQPLATPHISDFTVPFRDAPKDTTSSIDVTLAISGEEIMQFLRAAGGRAFLFPSPVQGWGHPSGARFDGSTSAMESVLQEIFRRPRLSISANIRLMPDRQEQIRIAEEEFLGFYQIHPPQPSGGRPYFHVSPDSQGELHVTGTQFVADGSADVRHQLVHTLRPRIYRFWAERFIIGTSNFGSNAVLSPNASNLPEVLNVLNANPARFEQLSEVLRQVLPQVRHVSVRPAGNNQVQILVWPIDKSTQKDYLTIPLNECGSGIAQVLAILYVVMVSEYPQVIIVDEPQNFLHPGAIKKLIEVLRRYPQHQYIFATHSPTVISAADPATVTMVRLVDSETRLTALDLKDRKDIQFSLAEIGARFSDVFGADNILWVEGQTEEICFPRILRTIGNISLMGTAIVGIHETGDLEGRQAKKIFQLYRRLTSSGAMLPPAAAYVLDRECRTQAQMNELVHESQNRATFLARRMYENYLLSAEAIAAVANGIEGFRSTAVTSEDVNALIDRMRQDLHYFCTGTRDVPADWVTHIDGAKMLRDIFQELSEARVSFEKTTHSVAITDWLLQNDRTALDQIVELLRPLLSPAEPEEAVRVGN